MVNLLKKVIFIRINKINSTELKLILYITFLTFFTHQNLLIKKKIFGNTGIFYHGNFEFDLGIFG